MTTRKEVRVLSLFRYRHGRRNSHSIALTFDDGPSWFTGEVLAILKQHPVPATFFLIPENIERLEKVAQQIVADGHEVGAHVAQPDSFALWSWRSFFEQASEEKIRRSLRTTEEVLGLRPRFFRPSPELMINRGTGKLLRKLDLVPVLASAYSRAKNPARIQERDVIRGLKPGAIILLHDGHDLRIESDRPRATVEALPGIIKAAAERGLRFVTLSKLLKTPPYQRSS